MSAVLQVPSARHRNAPFLPLLLNVLAWNAAISLAVGLLFWWFVGHGASSQIWKYCEISLVYSNVYGFLMGLSMPYIGPRVSSFPPPWPWILIVTALVALTAIGSLMVGLVFLSTGFYQHGQFWQHFVDDTAIGIVISLVIGLSIGVYDGFQTKLERAAMNLRTQELEKERAVKLASEAQLASLESRLNPHFLFNTLNSISTLIHEDPVRADRTLQRLAALLRFSLDASASRLVCLSLETKIVSDYLEIEKERLGARLSFTLDIPPQLESLKVPPLSIQTLVENSIKYAIASSPAGGSVQVSAHAADGNLVLEVCDSGPGFQHDSFPRGGGLDNLQSRLSTLFGDAANLAIHTQDKGSRVTVTLPQSTADLR
jgi:two-component system, LytTR family, sensor histidine kinase AlgZ